jgi:hypothetical protein
MIWRGLLLASGITDSYPVRGGEVQKQVVHYSCLRVLAAHTFLAAVAGWTGQRHTPHKEATEMSYSRTASASTAEALPEPSAAPSVEASSTEVLITEQEVLFSTTAAVTARRLHISRRFVASIARLFAVSAPASRPRRSDYPKRYEFLERSLMAREMDRL